MISLILAAALSQVPITDVDAIVAQGMKAFEAPGVSVSVVKDGKVVFTKGYGVRRLGQPAPVTENTLFGIGSCTKAFTTALLALLVEDGKLSWDDRVSERLPGFAMFDPWVTRELTVRDLVVHDSGLGLGAGDLLWMATTYSAAEITSRLRFIRPATSFRSGYAYDNVLYIVAGQLIEKVSGRPWSQLVRERIFSKLKMTGSNTSITQNRPGADVSAPHQTVSGKVVPIDVFNLDRAAAAGAINSSAADMAKWLAALLEGRAVSAEQRELLWTPVVPINSFGEENPKELRPSLAAYAPGWSVRDWRGKKMVHHAGGLPGFTAQVILIPEEKLGVVVLSSQTAFAAGPIAYAVADRYLGFADKDWVELSRANTERLGQKRKQAVQAASTSRAPSKPSLPLEKYAGTYRDSWFGEATIGLETGKPVLRFKPSPPMVADLEHFQYDTFIARWRDRTLDADAYVTFALKPDGTIDQVKMTPVSEATDFSFDFDDLLFRRVGPLP